MAEGSARSRSRLYLKIVVVLIAAAAVVALLLRGVDWRTWLDEGKAFILRAGPVAFFGGMALLPVCGAPLFVFYVTASAFKATLGLGGVLAATAGAIAVNLTLTYWLARRWLRPWLEKLVTRLGHRIPRVPPEDQFEVTMLVRVVPGPPFFLQSYLLGLAEIPFRIYFAVSWVITMAMASAVIVFSDALLQGRSREALFGGSLIVAVALAVHLLRKHYGKKKKTSAV
jgi:uncharacterized membrane protein YdjX (TVP38/TMEM64 family)